MVEKTEFETEFQLELEFVFELEFESKFEIEFEIKIKTELEFEFKEVVNNYKSNNLIGHWRTMWWTMCVVY